MADKLDALHNWLFSLSRGEAGTTVIDIMDELKHLREGGASLDDLPGDGISCHQLLERLEADGRAVRDGSFWRWAGGKSQTPRVVQREMF